MNIERVWAMPNKWTFTIKPIKQLLVEEMGVGMFIKGLWCDPFCGKNSPSQITNDINLDIEATAHYDALHFLNSRKRHEFDGILYDPPYSITQARMYGKKEFASMSYWKQCKDRIAIITKLGGKVICFGWNSMGLGKNRGFKMTRVLLVPHGGSKNDTIVTVEVKEVT